MIVVPPQLNFICLRHLSKQTSPHKAGLFAANQRQGGNAAETNLNRIELSPPQFDFAY
jgi:hypothetical protein